MNDDPQYELDDELLSAYLDDELSSEERALVESRLAADPAARSALEELRNVSQAVGGLPRKPLGRDFSESILRQVASARVARPRLGVGVEAPSQDMPTQNRGHGTLPKLTIGRTGRGWIWASLAAAAALLIMVFQPDGEREGKLTELAQNRDSERAEDAKENDVVGAGAELRAWNGPEEQERVPGVESLDASASTKLEVAESGAPSAAGESAGATDAPESDRLSVAPSGDRVESERNDTFFDVQDRELDSSADKDQRNEDELVVVHVRAKRTALENKMFEQILANNGIAIEPEAPAEQSAGAPRDLYREHAVSGRALAPTPEEAAADKADVELVLVEAPQQAVMSCMADLNNDSSNYLGVSVDDSTADDDVSHFDGALGKKLTTDLSQFSRGVVPQHQKDKFTRDKATYYPFGVEGRNGREVPRLGDGVGGESGVNEQLGQPLMKESESNVGRARRLQTQAAESRLGGARPSRNEGIDGDVRTAGSLKKREELQRQLKDSAKANEDRVQVLFVLSPADEPASSAESENRAE